MKVPLIGITSPYTINLETGDLQAVMYCNGKKDVAKVPYKPYCYVPDEEGAEEDEQRELQDGEAIKRIEVGKSASL